MMMSRQVCIPGWEREFNGDEELLLCMLGLQEVGKKCMLDKCRTTADELEWYAKVGKEEESCLL